MKRVLALLLASLTASGAAADYIGPDGKTRVLGYVKDVGAGSVAYVALGHCHSPLSNGQPFVDASVADDGVTPTTLRGRPVSLTIAPNRSLGRRRALRPSGMNSRVHSRSSARG